MDFVKKHIYVIAAALCVAAIGVLYAVQVHRPQVETMAEPVVLFDANENGEDTVPAANTAGITPTIKPTPVPEEITVYISGSVVAPGVYTVPYESRVNEVLALAGGFAEDANESGINLAARLSDAQHIIVPAVGETVIPVPSAEKPVETTKTIISNGLVNINTAGADELQTLTGIGETIAGYIIAYRETYGGFKSIDELMEVERIGPVTYEQLKDYITVN